MKSNLLKFSKKFLTIFGKKLHLYSEGKKSLLIIYCPAASFSMPPLRKKPLDTPFRLNPLLYPILFIPRGFASFLMKEKAPR